MLQKNERQSISLQQAELRARIRLAEAQAAAAELACDLAKAQRAAVEPSWLKRLAPHAFVFFAVATVAATFIGAIADLYQVAVIDRDKVTRENATLRARNAALQKSADRLKASEAVVSEQATKLAEAAARAMQLDEREAVVQSMLAALPSEKQERFALSQLRRQPQTFSQSSLYGALLIAWWNSEPREWLVALLADPAQSRYNGPELVADGALIGRGKNGKALGQEFSREWSGFWVYDNGSLVLKETFPTLPDDQHLLVEVNFSQGSDSGLWKVTRRRDSNAEIGFAQLIVPSK